MGIGIEWCDYLLAQSSEMARELLSPSSQVGMDGFFRLHRDKIYGVTKGIDTKKWNPLKDESIIAMFGKGDTRRRSPNRKWLLKELNLPENQPVIIAIDGAIPTTTEFAFVSEGESHYRTYLAGADFVITDIEHVWQVMCYGAIPIIHRQKVLPKIISDIASGGNAIVWGNETIKEVVAIASKIFSDRENMLSLQHKVMDSVPSFTDEYNDMMKFYNEIISKHIKS